MRIFLQLILNIFFLANKGLKNKLLSNHPKSKSNNTLFELMFQDSGHWDFFVLLSLDKIINLFFIQTALPLSEFFFIEKTSKLLFSLKSKFKSFLPIENLTLNPLYFSLSFAFSTLLTLFLTLSLIAYL